MDTMIGPIGNSVKYDFHMEAGRPPGGFTQWLSERLRAREMSAADLARAMDVRNSTVSRWLTGRQRPNWDYCIRIADALNLDENDVLAAAGYLAAVMEPRPDDPAEILCRKLRSVELTYERTAWLSAALESMADTDRRNRAAREDDHS